jgi:small subunit ribosomal protein S16
MLVIRLLRRGKRNQPFFKIVVTDKRNPPKGGRFTDIIGFINPLTKEKKIDAEKAKYWISVGAQMSDTVNNLLIREKVIIGKKINKTRRKKNETTEA